MKPEPNLYLPRIVTEPTRMDTSFAVIVFAGCTFLIGIMLRQTLIVLFYEWGLEPSYALVSVLNIFVLLPFFGVLTYMRHALLGNYSLPSIGYFVWVSPILFAIIWAYAAISGILPIYISSVFGGSLGVAIVITVRSIYKQRRELETDHGGL